MRNLLLLLLLIFTFVAQAGVCGSVSVKKDITQKLKESNDRHLKVSANIFENFRTDNRFADYIRSRSQLFMYDRQRVVASVYTKTSGANTNEEAIIAFITKFNNDEINYYKTVVQEYCKYNAFKYEKKDPAACSQERINSLFYTMP